MRRCKFERALYISFFAGDPRSVEQSCLMTEVLRPHAFFKLRRYDQPFSFQPQQSQALHFFCIRPSKASAEIVPL